MPNLFVDGAGAQPLTVDPVLVTAADLAAYVHDLLDARGLRPVLTPETRAAAEHAAALLLGAFAVSETRAPDQP